MTDEGDDLIIAEVGEEAVKAISTRDAIKMECLEHLWRAIPYGTVFDLSNGLKGQIQKFTEPRLDDEDLPSAGVDVHLIKDGKRIGEVEFCIYQSGWGMMLAEPVGEDE